MFPTTQSELDIDINFFTIAARRSPQGTIPLVAIGSVSTGTGNSLTACKGTDTDP